MTGRSFASFGRIINGLGTLTGANTLDVATIGIDQALLTFNVSLLTDAYQRVHLELQIKNVTAADGIRLDGSFGLWIPKRSIYIRCLTKSLLGQHYGILYNGNYGVYMYLR